MKTEIKLSLMSFVLAVTASLCWCYAQSVRLVPKTNIVYEYEIGTNVALATYTNYVFDPNVPPTWSAEDFISKAKENHTLTNLVNLLVSSGDFCRIRGHVWHFGNGGTNGWYGVTFDSEFKDSRRCGVCGRIETRQMFQWKVP